MYTKNFGCLRLTTFMGALCFVEVLLVPEPEEIPIFDDEQEQSVAPPEPSWHEELVAGIRSLIPKFMWRVAN